MFVLWAKTDPKPLGDACFTATFGLWNAHKMRIGQGRNYKLKFRKIPFMIDF